MTVLDENTGFIRVFIEKIDFFGFFVLIPGSFGDSLGIGNQFYSIEKSNVYKKTFCLSWPET